MMKNTRQVERLGLTYLINALESEGIQIALPQYDSGIDLIAYKCKPFVAVPIQLKASTETGFYTSQKYLKIQGLFIVYLWHVSGNLERILSPCLSYPDAEAIVDSLNFSRKDGVYFHKGSKRLTKALEPYEVKSWGKVLFKES